MKHTMRLMVLVAALASANIRLSAAQTGPLADCAALLADYAPVMGTDRYPTPAEMPLPAVRQAWRDPVFGTCLVRVTDRLHDGETPQAGMKNEYSRVQAFNADESLILVRSVEADWFLYDARTLVPIQRVAAEIAIDEPRWDGQDPHRFKFSPWWDSTEPLYMQADLIPAGDRFEVSVSRSRSFKDDLPPDWRAALVWRRWEGSPSFDGRYDAFMAEDADFITRGLVSYDWAADRVLGTYTVPHGEINEPDNVGMSPLGTYVLAQFEACAEGTLGTYEAPCGGMVYTRDLAQGWGVARSIGHNDVAIDVQGREVVVYQDPAADQIAMTVLETGETIPLLDLDFSGGVYGLHISGQAARRPGWAAVSVHPEAPSLDFNNPFWMVGTVFALELAENPRVVQLAHHHSIRSDTEADYFAEPQVTVNRDFTRLLFTSNWGAYGPGEVEMYLVVLPDDWIDRLP